MGWRLYAFKRDGRDGVAAIKRKRQVKGQTNHFVVDHMLQRNLRSRMTDAENCLWRRLRARQLAGHKFRRQHPFLDYVLDFVCLEMRLIVEVDGGQHLDCGTDLVRDRRLNEAGFRVMRFWNNQVLCQTEDVVQAIWGALQEGSGDGISPDAPSQTPSPPRPPLEGEGEGALGGRLR